MSKTARRGVSTRDTRFPPKAYWQRRARVDEVQRFTIAEALRAVGARMLRQRSRTSTRTRPLEGLGTIDASCGPAEVAVDWLAPPLPLLTVRFPFGAQYAWMPQGLLKCRLLSSRMPKARRRWWFCCPRCSERVGILYWGEWWACRRCHGLSYPSESRSRRKEAVRRRDLLAYRLGAWKWPSQTPARPRGMWTRTYARLLDRLRRAEVAAHDQRRLRVGRRRSRMY